MLTWAMGQPLCPALSRPIAGLHQSDLAILHLQRSPRGAAVPGISVLGLEHPMLCPQKSSVSHLLCHLEEYQDLQPRFWPLAFL